DEACKLVTTDACNKLKDDWNKDGNENLRIYVIKYRKQTAHYGAYYFNGSNGKIAQATITDNAAAYSYLDACASSGSYVYDVANEAGLNDKLQEIATNIKEWANYTPATK
ncbi:MAG: hypothetical protein LBJ71_03220, partial [Holosporaceae bacterium]|nr:hypothetical protein [Holosporaceae bacterium]